MPLNREFHGRLVALADQPAMASALAGAIHAPIVLRNFHTYDEASLRRSLAHHLEIVAAVRAGDPAWAQAVMTAHIRNARAVMVRAASQEDNVTYRLGVDVGGTFTDVLLVEEGSGATWRAKTASTPSDQAVGVRNGIAKVCDEAGIALSDVAQVLHGTTVATNAILEGKGATVGLVTTKGFRQVLQIARSYVPGGLAGWIIWPKPEPLAALENTVEVDERIASDGTVIRELDDADVRAQLAKLHGDRRARRLADQLLRRPGPRAPHRRARRARCCPACRCRCPRTCCRRCASTSARSPPSRTATSSRRSSATSRRWPPGCARAAWRASWPSCAATAGCRRPRPRSAAPVTMLLSGPAGGVTGAVWMAEQCGYADLITFDMGGTSTDVALVQGLSPRIGRETKVGDLTVRASSVDVRTVGAGGGSIAHVPGARRRRCGSARSRAGADPGPAAYGKGGTEPTVTDANVVLGYLPPSLAGGEITLDVDAARAAVQTVADAMGLESVEAAAAGIVDIVNENMLGGLRLVSVQQGFDPRDFALVAFGGAGPLHANALGRLTGAWPVIVPPSPGVLCALGDATTSARSESARTVSATLRRRRRPARDPRRARRRGGRGASPSRACPPSSRPPRTRWTCATTGRASRSRSTVDASGPRRTLAAAFDAEHERLFSFLLTVDHELVNARATVTGPRPSVSPRSPWRAATAPTDGRTDTAPDLRRGRFGRRRDLRPARRCAPATCISGPAIVTEMDSTTLVLPGHAATVHASGSPAHPPATGRRR